MGLFLNNCDIVHIVNRENNAMLTVSERNVKKYFTADKKLVKIM